MVKVGVVFADGCEEVEGLSVIDVLRRLNIQADMIGLTSTQILGDHQIRLSTDKVVDKTLLNYDLIAFPGGKTGAENLRDHDKLHDLMVQRQNNHQWNAAMCAAPIALARFGLLNQATYTCYPGFEKQTIADAPNGHFVNNITVRDDHAKIITSRGPATAWAFAYTIAQALGFQTDELEAGMLYTFLTQNFDRGLIIK